ncbi:hypothetical protein C8J56DRAFT_920510 [Mycena floridula]|nr:hypothetical protein C8J56DRAFT_920510 [Mycena floridula]
MTQIVTVLPTSGLLWVRHPPFFIMSNHIVEHDASSLSGISSTPSEISSTLVVSPPILGKPMPHARGHIQPHVSNLPRRKPRIRRIEASFPSSSSDGSASSAARIVATSPAIPSIVALAAQAPTPAQSKSLPFIQHQGPHVSNLPRRRVVMSPQKRRRIWLEQTQIQEILPESGIFMSFSSPDREDMDEHSRAEWENFGKFDCIITIEASETTGVVQSGTSMTISVSKDCLDLGISHLSKEQMLEAWTFLSSHNRQLICTTADRAVDALAIAVGYLASKPTSISCCPDQDLSSAEENVHNIISHLHDYHDDTLNETWKGLLSRDGVEWLEHFLGNLE